MKAPETPPLELLRLTVAAARRHVVLLAASFAAIALAVLALGAILPKRYESHAVILAESKNIIAPLMEGRAVTTGVTDRATVVGQAMKGRRILREVMAFGGWPEMKDPRAEDRFLRTLADRIKISQIGTELINVSYTDTDPERCFAIANKLADIYIREGTGAKARQSSEAFDFIDGQVTEYAAKVAAAQEAVQAYYRAHGLSAGRLGSARAEPTDPRRSAARIPPKALAALRAEEAVLAAELGPTGWSPARQRRDDHIQQLQRELDTLLAMYTDRHPNVQRVREELRTAQEEAARANAVEEPSVRATRARLQEVRSQIGAATEVVLPPAAAAAQAASPEMIVAGQDATLAELTRRYESTRDVYQDLLKRRENARVSMELDAEQRGLTFRVYERAEVPLVPISMRLMHVLLIGLTLAVVLPVGLLFAYVRLNPRILSVRQLERSALAPLLVPIPYAPVPRDRSAERRRILLAATIVLAVIASYAAYLAVRVVS
jgi:polysaccharide chain length determinant protein (PEP-CTERM system associated)